jgi:hypothetical protein
MPDTDWDNIAEQEAEARAEARDWLTGANPSWYVLVLAVLHRDYPHIETAVWSTAVNENAAEQEARRAAEVRWSAIEGVDDGDDD